MPSWLVGAAAWFYIRFLFFLTKTGLLRHKVLAHASMPKFTFSMKRIQYNSLLLPHNLSSRRFVRVPSVVTGVSTSIASACSQKGGDWSAEPSWHKLTISIGSIRSLKRKCSNQTSGDQFPRNAVWWFFWDCEVGKQIMFRSAPLFQARVHLRLDFHARFSTWTILETVIWHNLGAWTLSLGKPHTKVVWSKRMMAMKKPSANTMYLEFGSTKMEYPTPSNQRLGCALRHLRFGQLDDYKVELKYSKMLGIPKTAGASRLRIYIYV